VVEKKKIKGKGFALMLFPGSSRKMNEIRSLLALAAAPT